MAHRVNGGDPNLMDDNGGWACSRAASSAAAVFLAVETVLFHGIAYLNDADDEAWLRRTLAGRSFYVTEAAVLLMGALSAAVWTAGAWFLLLLVPVYGLAQRAALHEPLRERAETDGKTGLLRFESWRSSRSPSSGAATSRDAGVERGLRRPRPLQGLQRRLRPPRR